MAYECGNGMVLVYESAYAGTNKATAVNFDVPLSAFDDEIGTLREKGVMFTTFELEGAIGTKALPQRAIPRRSGSKTRMATFQRLHRRDVASWPLVRVDRTSRTPSRSSPILSRPPQAVSGPRRPAMAQMRNSQ